MQCYNSNLEYPSIWLQRNELSLNVAKTQSMIFGFTSNLRKLDGNDRNDSPLFQINDEEIVSMGNIRYLGAQIDPSFDWKEQVNVSNGKISRGIGMLKHSKSYLSLQTIQKMYFSIVDPNARYCYSVWRCAGYTILRKLDGTKSCYSCCHKQSL